MDKSRRDFLKTSLAVGVAAGAALSPIPVDALAQARTPNIDALIARGSASMQTRDVMPSVTLPNFTSILTGSGPEVHGVDNNDWKVDKFRLPAVETDEDGYYPSVFKVLKDNVPGIKKGFEITEANNTVNTASTVLHLFGVEQPLCWTGEVPMSMMV